MIIWEIFHNYFDLIRINKLSRLMIVSYQILSTSWYKKTNETTSLMQSEVIMKVDKLISI